MPLKEGCAVWPLAGKAWLFCGSDRGGQRAAMMYSLIVTAKMNHVDPQAWLADVLSRIASHPVHRLDELLPWNWRPNHRLAPGPGGLIMHVNKVHSVKTIDRVARELGESVDWLFDVADEMDTEDGVIWVYGDTDDGVMAFTDFGIETLTPHRNAQGRPHDPGAPERTHIDTLRSATDGYDFRTLSRAAPRVSQSPF